MMGRIVAVSALVRPFAPEHSLVRLPRTLRR